MIFGGHRRDRQFQVRFLGCKKWTMQFYEDMCVAPYPPNHFHRTATDEAIKRISGSVSCRLPKERSAQAPFPLSAADLAPPMPICHGKQTFCRPRRDNAVSPYLAAHPKFPLSLPFPQAQHRERCLLSTPKNQHQSHNQDFYS